MIADRQAKNRGAGSPPPEHQPGDSAPEAVVRLIRQRSRHGLLTTMADLEAEQEARPEIQAAQCEAPTALISLLATAQGQYADLQSLPAADGTPQLHSTDFMTEAYARLLVQRTGDPLELMAGIVREYSQLYPRPFPLGGFERPPFSMSREEALQFLENMGGLLSYQDIAQTITSAGHVYLYSTRYLETDYATALAEWIDVGQPKSP